MWEHYSLVSDLVKTIARLKTTVRYCNQLVGVMFTVWFVWSGTENPKQRLSWVHRSFPAFNSVHHIPGPMPCMWIFMSIPDYMGFSWVLPSTSKKKKKNLLKTKVCARVQLWCLADHVIRLQIMVLYYCVDNNQILKCASKLLITLIITVFIKLDLDVSCIVLNWPFFYTENIGLAVACKPPIYHPKYY